MRKTNPFFLIRLVVCLLCIQCAFAQQAVWTWEQTWVEPVRPWITQAALMHPSGGCVVGYRTENPSTWGNHLGMLRFTPTGDTIRHVRVRCITQQSTFAYHPHDTLNSPGGSYYIIYRQDSLARNSRGQLYQARWRWVVERYDTSLTLLDSVFIPLSVLGQRDDVLPPFNQVLPGPRGDLIAVRSLASTQFPQAITAIHAYRLNPRTGRVAWQQEFHLGFVNAAQNIQPLDSGRILIGAYAGARPWRLVIDTSGFVRDSRLGPELRVGPQLLRPQFVSVWQMPDRSTLWDASSATSPRGFDYVPATFRGIDGPRADNPTADIADHGGPWRYRRYNRNGVPLPHDRYRVVAVNQDGSIIRLRDSITTQSSSNGLHVVFLERVNTGTVPPGFPSNSPTDTAVRWSLPIWHIVPRLTWIWHVLYQNEFDAIRPGGDPQSENAYIVGENGGGRAIVALVSGIGRRYNPLSSPPRSSPVVAARVRVWPNPARGGATLQLDLGPMAGTHPSQIELRDVQGRLILRQRLQSRGTASLTLPADLPAGVYLWQVWAGGSGRAPAHGRLVITGAYLR